MSILQKSLYGGPYARVIDIQISNIESSLRRFEAAVMLFEQARHAMIQSINSRAIPIEREPYSDWQSMAARDGVVTLWSYSNALKSLANSLRNVEISGTEPNIEAFRSAKKDFEILFPNIRELRHAVCHLSDSMENPDKLDKAYLQESFDSPIANVGAGTLFIENMHDYTFITSWKGKPISYDISYKNLAGLKDISDRILRAVDIENRWWRERPS